jgi:pyruvate-formate lyase-activating enzyme
MNAIEHPRHENLYRLPWSVNDNPIGWLEVTDTCNLVCKGCYRLIKDGHKPLQQLKEEVLFLKKWRQCDNISLAGGEPVLHPNILELISFIRENKMKAIVHTNGYAFTEELVRDLKKAGLVGINFHIDSTQARPEFHKKPINSESELNEIRMRFAKMVHKVGGITVSFGITVHAGNVKETADYLKWAMKHTKYVHGISMICFRGLPTNVGASYFDENGNKINMRPGLLGYAMDKSPEEPFDVTSNDIYALLKKEIPDYDATAYLGGTADHTSFKWLFGNVIVDGKGRTFGSYGKTMMEVCQTIYHWINGSYIVHTRKRLGREIFIFALIDKKIRKALWKYAKYILSNPLRLFNRVNALGIGMIQAPDLMPDGNINMCDDCPDMCVFEGKLVNSCRLDEYRFYGGPLHAHISKAEERIPEKKSIRIEEEKIVIEDNS